MEQHADHGDGVDKALRMALADHPSLSQLGDKRLDQLVPMLYRELRVIAHAARRQQRPDSSLGTTSIVHEAYLKLKGKSGLDPTSPVAWLNRAQFLHLAALAMRSILVDNARNRSRIKRGGDQQQVPIQEALLVSAQRSDELLLLDAALNRLAQERHRWADVLTCRVFGGMELAEVAEALSISLATVKRDWQAACIWLRQDLGESANL